MKRLVFVLMAVAAMGNSFAECSITYRSSSNKVMEIVGKSSWNFDNYNGVCAQLEKADAGFQISAQGVVLDGKSIGWASVNVVSRNGIFSTSDYGGLSTQTNNYASQDKANELMMLAINNAVNSMDLPKALRSLNEQRSKEKAIYGKK